MKRGRDLRADIVIIGGGVGGCAAALAALEQGKTVLMTEEFAWIGGQFTSQAVPPDEHGWIERMGCTARYRRFRNAIRDYYRGHYPLRPEYRGLPNLNPGNGWVSPLCHEPRVALAVLHALFQPYIASRRLRLLPLTRPIEVLPSGKDQIAGVVVVDTKGQSSTLRGNYYLDATENGDLLPLGNVEHRCGSESKAETGEPSARKEADPRNVQAISVCFVLEEGESESDLVKPASYERWRSFEPSLTPPWPGKLLSWQGLNPRTMQPMHYNFHPHGEKPGLFSGLWAFRRIVDRAQFEDRYFSSDLCLVNWPMIDYMPKEILICTHEERLARIEEAKQLSLSMLFWLQTEAPRPDGGTGWPKLRLRPDVMGTEDGLAMAPYIRESRRIQAIRTIREQDVSEVYRPGDVLAERYEDSVGVGYYRIDLHPTTGGDNYVDVPSLPFRIPLSSLVPVRIENLLPAAKNIGTTHITNGCYRLHPVEWNIGEAAGLLAVFCMEKGVAPQRVSTDQQLFVGFQQWIRNQGIETEWPEDIRLDDGDPHAHAR